MMYTMGCLCVTRIVRSEAPLKGLGQTSPSPLGVKARKKSGRTHAPGTLDRRVASLLAMTIPAESNLLSALRAHRHGLRDATAPTQRRRHRDDRESHGQGAPR